MRGFGRWKSPVGYRGIALIRDLSDEVTPQAETKR